MERPIAELDSLPPELLELVLLWTVRMCRCEKNKVLPLRCVSKAFNTTLRPYVLKTIQLEFSRFLNQPSNDALEAIGGFCQAVYLDMMVVRDEGTLKCLSGVCAAVAGFEMGVAGRRSKYTVGSSRKTWPMAACLVYSALEAGYTYSQ